MENEPERMTRDERAEYARTRRYETILKAALDEAEAVGLANLRRRNVAARAGVANGSINHAFDSMGGLVKRVVEAACAHRRLPIVAEALANRELSYLVPDELRNDALAALAA
jgi:AcrR family transcriptional regulator